MLFLSRSISSKSFNRDGFRSTTISSFVHNETLRKAPSRMSGR
jgi:hypothetical protein